MARKVIVIGFIGLLIALSNAAKEFELKVGVNAIKAVSGVQPAISHDTNYAPSKTHCSVSFPILCNYPNEKSHEEGKSYAICIKDETRNFKDATDLKVISKDTADKWKVYDNTVMQCKKAENVHDDDLFDFLINDWSMCSINKINRLKPYCTAVKETNKDWPYVLALDYPAEEREKLLKKMFDQFQKKETIDGLDIQCFGNFEVSTQKTIVNANFEKVKVLNKLKAKEKSIDATINEYRDTTIDQNRKNSTWWDSNLLRVLFIIVVIGVIGGFLIVYLGSDEVGNNDTESNDENEAPGP